MGEAVLEVFRDFGNRSDRKRARLKSIIHGWGMPACRARVEEYLGRPLPDPRPIRVTRVDDHLGWHAQGDGQLFLGIPVENGRIHDDGNDRLSRAVTGCLAHGGGKRGLSPGRLHRGFAPSEAVRAGCLSPFFPEPVPPEALSPAAFAPSSPRTGGRPA
jgi:hypothetical protein